jgi:glycosyltransferase involved in cell wall biosynthesis
MLSQRGRIAWFSPVPPAPSGVAAVSAELLPALRGRGYVIDVYVNGGAGSPETSSAHDFLWRHLQQPYGRIVYQLGNSSHHDYAWAYALRYPGLVVLHDTRLHHARASHLLRERRRTDYRAELAFDEPAVREGAAEIAIAGFDSCLYYDWPMVRGLVETAALVAVHGEGTRRELIDALRPSSYDDRIVSIRLGHGERLTPERERAARRRVREMYSIADEAVVFGVLGGLTPEKRIPQILKAFAAAAGTIPAATLLFAGAPATYYDLRADVAAHGLQNRVTIAGYLESEADFTDHLAACDVSVNLRWPTARETSGPWLRALAAGRATIITDLVHLAGVPSLDPRTWNPTTSNVPSPVPAPRSPICVSIDILDEEHSLRLAMRRLGTDAGLRAELGRAATEWWQREHSIAAMADDYERVMCEAGSPKAEPNGAALPAHLRDEGSEGRELMDVLLAPFNLQRDTL